MDASGIFKRASSIKKSVLIFFKYKIRREQSKTAQDIFI